MVSGNGPNLLGREWLTPLEVNLQNLNSISSTSPLQQLLASHPTVFGEDLGCYNGPPVKLAVNKDAQPTFYKARPVPFALRSKVEDELTRLQSQGIISPVKHSVWAAPIVPVLKNSGRVRLCGDYKLTINKASPTETYPLPVVDELFANLSGGKYFSKLDLSNAYIQFPLDDASKQYVTINTHKGLFQYNHLPFGVASAPAIFQRHMEMLLQGLPNVSVYIDDILVAGATREEHLQTLDEVLRRLEHAQLRLNRAKCFFLRSSIEYLAHIIDEHCIHPTSAKVDAIKQALPPNNLTLNYAPSWACSIITTSSCPTSHLSLPLSTHFSTNTRNGTGNRSSNRLSSWPKMPSSLMPFLFITTLVNPWCWHAMPRTLASEPFSPIPWRMAWRDQSRISPEL